MHSRWQSLLRSSTLAENASFSCHAHNVVDCEKVGGEVQFFDQIHLMLDLFLNRSGNPFGVSGLKTEFCPVFKPAQRRVLWWDKFVGVAVLQLSQVKEAALRYR